MGDHETGKDRNAALRKLYEQAFWLYTVIIALAIRQVLIEIIPRFLNHYFGTGLPLPTPATTSFGVGLVRSIAFLIVITRFYLGGVLIFSGLTKNGVEPPAGSWTHVLTGFIHFLLFFLWAYTPFIGASIRRVSLFLCVLISILLWDVIWFVLSPKRQESQIKPWLYRNLRTVIYMGVIFLVTLWFASPQTSEMVMLIPIVVISMKDFIEMFTKREPPPKFLAFL